MGIKGLGAVYATQGGERLLGRIKTKKQHKQIYISRRSGTSGGRFFVWTLMYIVLPCSCVRAAAALLPLQPSKISRLYANFLWPHPRELRRYSPARRLACFLL